jgi:hypothetical protein
MESFQWWFYCRYWWHRFQAANLNNKPKISFLVQLILLQDSF